jgi:hypothetical protein
VADEVIEDFVRRYAADDVDVRVELPDRRGAPRPDPMAT